MHNPYRGNQNLMDNLKRFFKSKEVLPILILINIGVFLIVNILALIGWLFKATEYQGLSALAYYLSVPASFTQLISRPWTIITYMFTQEGLFHILFNMILLYFSGNIFKQYLSSVKLLTVYVLGGIFGAAFYLAAYNLFPIFEKDVWNSVALGASASVLAVLFTVVSLAPDLKVRFFGVLTLKLKYLAIFIFIFDLLSIRDGNNAGGHISHIGGASFGLLYGFLYRKNLIVNMDSFFQKIINLFKFNQKRKFRVYEGGRPLSDEEYNDQKAETKHHLDEILDKISKSGYDKLSKEEKDFLFKQSNKNN